MFIVAGAPVRREKSCAIIASPGEIYRLQVKRMWVDVTGGRLYLEQAGAGTPLLLMHGWTLDRRMFAPQMSRLSEYFHAIVYDRRGFGRSGLAPDHGLELDDLDRIADALSLDSLHLLGMSQGARLALRYAVTRPQRLRSLILQGAVVDGLVVDGPEHENIPFFDYTELARAGKMEVMRRRWSQHPLLALRPGLEDARRLLDDILNDYNGADLLDFSPQTFTTSLDVLGKLPRLRVPVLILTGAMETVRLRAHAKKLLELIPDSREVVFEHSGHLSNLSEPELFNEQVLRFCRSVDEALSSM